MKTLTYHLQSDSKDYYGEISKFTSQVLEESEGFLGSLIEEFQSYVFEDSSKIDSKNLKKEESVLEALMIGVFWNSYAKRSTQLNERPQKLMASLSRLRNDIPTLKEEIDDIRGMLSTMFLLEDNSKEEEFPELTIKNMDSLLKWLEATGDYNHELKHLKVWEDFLRSKCSEETSLALTQILMFADWFQEAACENLSHFTPHVNDFIQENLVEHLDKEDMIFCGRKQVEYHLNMVGAEVMNRVFRESFESRPRKAVLVPGCMKHHNRKCAAKEEKLGFKCVLCSEKCSISQITSKGLKEEFEVYIISHESSAFSQSTAKDQEELGIVGVACVNNLVAGGWKSDALGIPAQCVILEYASCQKHWHETGIPTQINQEELEKILGH